MLDQQNCCAQFDHHGKTVQEWRMQVPVVRTAELIASKKSFFDGCRPASMRDLPTEDQIDQLAAGQSYQQTPDHIRQPFNCQFDRQEEEVELSAPSKELEETDNCLVGSPSSVLSSCDSEVPALLFEESESFLSDADESSRSFPELRRKVSFSETIEIFIVPSRRKNGQPQKRRNVPMKELSQNQPVFPESMFSMRVWDLEDSDTSLEGFEQCPPTSCVP